MEYCNRLRKCFSEMSKGADQTAPVFSARFLFLPSVQDLRVSLVRIAPLSDGFFIFMGC